MEYFSSEQFKYDPESKIHYTRLANLTDNPMELFSKFNNENKDVGFTMYNDLNEEWQLVLDKVNRSGSGKIVSWEFVLSDLQKAAGLPTTRVQIIKDRK